MRVSILLVLVGAAFAVPKQPNRIVGGSDTSVQEYPYMVNMRYGIDWTYMACGGSLITTQSVLSAAHCYSGYSVSIWSVVVGTSTVTGFGGTTHTISRIILHEGYNEQTLVNDVAVVRLSVSVTISDNVALASIPGPNYNLADGTLITAVGWGMLYDEGPFPMQLQHVDLPIINQEVCADRYKSINEVTANMFCLGFLDQGGKDTCDGDSGGPAVHNRNVVVGITSWGLGCASPDYPGVYTRVNSYTDWIVLHAS